MNQQRHDAAVITVMVIVAILAIASIAAMLTAAHKEQKYPSNIEISQPGPISNDPCISNPKLAGCEKGA